MEERRIAQAEPSSFPEFLEQCDSDDGFPPPMPKSINSEAIKFKLGLPKLAI
jgi:hypothetical protein